MPQENAGKTVLLVEDAERPFTAYVNGTLCQFSGIPSSNPHVEINITPFIHFGQDNRIQVVSVYGKGNVGRFALDLYDPAAYP